MPRAGGTTLDGLVHRAAHLVEFAVLGGLVVRRAVEHRIEQDLIGQLFNSCEKRLARTLLLLARYGKQDKPVRMVPKISQATLAEMIGTTRSRVNFFMNKFRKLGLIEYNGVLKVHSSLLNVIIRE